MARAAVRLICLALLIVTSAGPASANKRVALVIGNSAYAHTQPLANPENDARLMASVLSRRGFEVLAHTNLGFKGMKRAAKAFTTKLEAYGKDTIGLIFYAGHGIQSEGRNYLVPVDAKIDKEGDIEIETISSDSLLSGVRIAGNRLNIIILDACRNNPYKGRFRSASRGLARIDAPVGSLVAFSTAPGTVAADGASANSPYTAALAKAMAVPDMKIEEVFKRVRNTVYAATKGKQVPWESSSIFGDFYFSTTRQIAVEAKPETPAPAPARPSATTGEAAEIWKTIKGTEDPDELEAFIARYGDSFYGTLAAKKLARLKSGQTTTAALPKPGLVGRYASRGTNPNGSKYQGRVTISRKGATYYPALGHRRDRLQGPRQAEGRCADHRLGTVEPGDLQGPAQRRAGRHLVQRAGERNPLSSEVEWRISRYRHPLRRAAPR